MSQPSDQPPVLIELLGPMPPKGYLWCATCAILYIGEVSADLTVQGMAQLAVEQAIENGETTVTFTLPPSWRTLRPPITIAPSVYFPYPMPVCWVHLQGAKPGSQEISDGQSNATPLVKGKKGQLPR